MITAVFNDKMDYTIAYGLWQWDYGQVLRVKGLDFNQISIEVHFSLSPDNTDSLVTIGVVKDIDYQSTIVSDGEEYTVNETATVLDVVIPKDMLWNNIKKNYTIYVFLLSTNEESGETLKRIIMPVKVKPKPIYSVTPEDEELFHRVVEEVNTFAETAKEHSNISKSYAVGNTGTRENEDIDNAKYYAEQSALSAEASEQSASNALVSENHALDSENSALGAESRARAYATEAKDLKQEYDNTLALTKEYRDSAQASAISASANLRDTVTARNIATQASADANNFLNQTQAVYDLAVEVKQEVNETKADVTAISTEIATTGTEINTVKNEIIAIKSEVDDIKSEIDDDKAIIDTKKTAIDNQAIAVANNVAQSNQIKTDIIHLKDDTILIKEETSDIKDATDEIKTDVISIANNLNNSIDTKISEHNESTTAHPDIRSLISSLTNKLNTFLDTDDESLDQISELITFIQNNRTLIEGITTSKIDKNQGIENASKGLIVGEDGYVTLGDIGYYPVEITSVNSNYQANHTCKEISDAFKDGLVPYAFIHGVEQNIFYLMTCSESLVGFVYLTKDNISIITISQDNTTTVNTNNPIIHTHQDISHKADKATTLSGYGITNAYTKGEVDNIVNNLDTGVTSVNNKTGNVIITAQELGALTEHQSLNGYATETWVNNQGYLTQHQSLTNYALKSEIPTVPTNLEEDRYKPYVTDSTSGAVASFTDGADDIPLKSLVVDINPVQSGSGDPSPDNVRPISGWTGANVTRCGKNLLSDNYSDYSTTNKYAYLNGVVPKGQTARFTFTDKDTSVDISECAIGFVYNDLSSKPVGKYRWVIDNGVMQSNVSNTFAQDYSILCSNVFIYPKTEEAFNKLFARYNIMVELGSTATDYEPYNGQTVTVDWQTEAGTVYGGSLDVLSGVLTVDRAMVILDEDDIANITVEGQNCRVFVTSGKISIFDSYKDGVCNKAVIKTSWGGVRGDKNAIAINLPTSNQFVVNSAFGTTLQEIKNFVGTGLQICTYLATPITIQLTPHEVKSLLGQNNIFADTGDSAVEYRADTKLYIERLTAPDSADMIADSNIVSGQYFMVSNALYKATTNIANGGQIIVGTNCTKVSLATALNEINA